MHSGAGQGPMAGPAAPSARETLSGATTEDAAAGGHERRGLEFERIVFFSDAVFAIAITLLALEIRVPELEAPAGDALPGAPLDLLPGIAAYALSFLVIALFWMGHHRIFHFIVDYDYRLAWRNLFFLLGVAFIPVPTQVIAKYGDLPLATIFYAASLTVVALLEFAIWHYASGNRQLLRAGTSQRLTEYIGLRVLTMAAGFALSIPLALLNPSAAQLSRALIPLIQTALSRRYPHEHRQRE